MAAPPLINISRLCVATPDGRRLIDGLDLTLKPGELTVLKGPNGCGKSTLLKILMGWIKPSAGQVQTQLTPSQIGYLPQLVDPSTYLPLNLGDVIELYSSHYKANQLGGLISTEQLPLPWRSASGGEQKRTLMARLLVANHPLWLLDEPFNHLDESSYQLMLEALRNYLSKKDPGSVLLVTHQEPPQEFFGDIRIQSISLGPEVNG